MSMQEGAIICETWQRHHLQSANKQYSQIAFVKQAPDV